MAKRGRLKRTTKAGLKYPGEDQLKAFFKAVRKTRDADRPLGDDLAFGLAIFYGLRVCELAGLRLTHVDQRVRQIRIAAAKGGRTKTEDIPPDIWQKLDAWLKRRAEISPWLFPGRVDGRHCFSRHVEGLFQGPRGGRRAAGRLQRAQSQALLRDGTGPPGREPDQDQGLAAAPPRIVL